MNDVRELSLEEMELVAGGATRTWAGSIDPSPGDDIDATRTWAG